MKNSPLHNFDWSFKSIAKVLGLLLLGVVAVSIAIALIGFAFRTISPSTTYLERGGYGGGYAQNMAFDAAEEAVYSKSIGGGYIPPSPDFSTGDDAEDFEIKNHYASIKTRQLDRDCDVIASLKIRDDVIFEQADKNKKSCYYRFKTAKGNEAAIVDIINALDPESMNVSVQTIKRVIDDYDSELEILEKKLTSTEETLEGAQSAYDELNQLATEKEDIESLAKIIDSKLNLITKLSDERMRIKEQIDRYNKNKADQLERLNYSYFSVSIYEELLIDGEQIKNSWKYEIQALARSLNEVVQGITINLISYTARILQAVIYLVIALIFVKYGWRAAKYIWKK